MCRILRFIVLLLCLMLSVAQASFDCICGQEQCVCFIQTGDEGPAVKAVVRMLMQQGYLPPKMPVSLYSEQVTQAVIAFQKAHKRPETGMLDDETLTLLIWSVTCEELDAQNPLMLGTPVWIPTDGGRRHHSDPTCCDMYDPRLVSHRNALAMDMQRCGRCKPTGLDTILQWNRPTTDP